MTTKDLFSRLARSFQPTTPVVNRRKSRASLAIAGIVLGCATTSIAHAGWVYGNVSEIQFYSDGGATDRVVVVGTFNTGCTTPNAFVLSSTDHYFKEIYAAMLTAKTTGAPIKYLHIYCTPEGVSRGNAYALWE